MSNIHISLIAKKLERGISRAFSAFRLFLQSRKESRLFPGGRKLYCFFTFVSWPTPPASMTSHSNGQSLGSLVQISKEYDSYLDERGRGKAKKLANIAIYPLLIWSNVYELWCCYNLLVSTVLAFCVRDCIILLICFAGRFAGSPSISRDLQGHQNLNLFFSLK